MSTLSQLTAENAAEIAAAAAAAAQPASFDSDCDAPWCEQQQYREQLMRTPGLYACWRMRQRSAGKTETSTVSSR